MITAGSALDRLKAGNRRFVDGNLNSESLASPARRNTLVGDQKPFAIILGCSDSRVPAEVVFDQGLGELFVIRVAGNVVAPSQIGSVEFAAEMFGTSLVVVLGHTACGAISATIDQLRQDLRGTATRRRVNGRVAGLSPRMMRCTNLATGATAEQRSQLRRFDCAALGVPASPGDPMLIQIWGQVD